MLRGDTMTDTRPEQVLGELELTRGLTIQMTAIGTIGTLVGWTVFAGLYGFVSGSPVGFQYVPASVGWIATPLNGLVVLFLGTFFLVPHEWLHGLAIGGPIVLTALGVESVTIGTPGRLTYLFAFVNTSDEISLGVGPAVLAVGGAAGLAYAFVRTYRRRSVPTVAGEDR